MLALVGEEEFQSAAVGVSEGGAGGGRVAYVNSTVMGRARGDGAVEVWFILGLTPRGVDWESAFIMI